MAYIIFKYIVTATLIVLISELAKISDKVGALTSALPLVTITVLFWLFFENQSTEKIANHSYYTFWYVLPTLPMFLLFPWVIKQWSFWPAILISIIFTVLLFVIYVIILKKFGIDLL
ncbi:MAG: DUF3147 family protein [Nitrosomonadales bacterium]|jgi:hypothetical protein|nr:DUF3147 family protein [Nitrosomonadales bacterium]MBT5572910.1 DUF3147 family protein [Nitrosomonadales bacterium]MBT6251128.1 DUF3147 family protein [Nitrosomonadales bacterium]MBT7120974.1 DUF3147 family protein [Nitrosomonadales bacterium]MBT7690290.1 DUF3147 family protein [Nitrosomonadales bacterium]